jgi:hypothetical protein
MRRFYISVIFLISLFSISCNPSGGLGGNSDTAYVRIENFLTNNGINFDFHYGVAYGSTQFIGPLLFGTTTPYRAYTPGTYSLQGLLNTGAWVTFSTSFGVAGTTGHWTIVCTGDVNYPNSGTIVQLQLVKDY